MPRLNLPNSAAAKLFIPRGRLVIKQPYNQTPRTAAKRSGVFYIEIITHPIYHRISDQIIY